MWKSFVNRRSCDGVEEPRKPAPNAKPIYRDELEKKASKKKVEKKSYVSSTADKKDFEKKSYGVSSSADKQKVITVKVRMTKEEAARMLSKCKDGGFLDFKDVARELVNIPPNRVNLVSSEASIRPVLESFPEEL
jgi:predicted TIM-barrel fold metal-dependent hydrolase